MTGASIIIPVYNALKYARACLDSVYETRTSTPFEVIVVDNGSSAEVGVWLAQEQERHRNLVAMRFDQPLGFARAVNEGARRARYDALALLNSDAIVTDGWLDGLHDALLSDPRLGMVSPLTNYATNPRQVDQEAEFFNPREYSARIRNRRELGYEPERLIFFCAMIRRAVWELLAGLEEGYGVGNGEDNDFCLRARMVGYRLAVAQNAFVYHQGHATFRANGLDHRTWMARNLLLYNDRASRWAKSLELPNHGTKQSLPEVSVLVSVQRSQAADLRDSLISLANQTICGFETIVVSSAGPEAGLVADLVQEFADRLRISRILIDEARADQFPALLNAGMEATTGQRVAYLPAGDIFYPFHLELLSEVLCRLQVEAVYGAWSAVDGGIDPTSGRACRAVVPTYQPGHQLGLDNYPPLPCWMHSREALAGARFDESYRRFADWEFVLRMGQQMKVQYVPRISCEHRIGAERTAADPLQITEAKRLLQAFPADEPWQQENRAQFLKAVETGTEEQFSLLFSSPSRMVPEAGGTPPRNGSADSHRLLTIRDALARAIVHAKWAHRSPGLPDILYFSIIPWDHHVQRSHHFAWELAARGHHVFWVDLRLNSPETVNPESLPQELTPGLYYVELPGTEPTLYRLKWDVQVLATMQMAIAHLRAAFGIHNAIQLIQRPKWAPLAFRLRDRYGWPIVYDCVDDTKAFAAMNRHDGADFEDELAQRCDLLVVCSHLLYEDRRKHNPNTIKLFNACDFDMFHSAVPAGLLGHLPRPIVGFFGAISEWIDFDWIDAVARRFPHWSFVYIGPSNFTRSSIRERWESMKTVANIHIFPKTEPKKLAAYLAEFDVCTMPNLDLPMTRIMNAVKIYEYLAAAKAVVISNTPELQPLADRGLISMYRDYEHSFELLERAVRIPPTAEEIASRLAFASQNTWTKRVDDLAAAFLTIPNP